MADQHIPGPPAEKRSAASAATDPRSDQSKQHPVQPSATSRKWQRVLRALYNGRNLNRFEAARDLRDWCLNTTISQLERRGLTIARREESVPGAYGDVRCCRYRLADESRARAAELLGIST